MQHVQLVALVTQSFDPALPVLIRLVNGEVEFMPLDPDNLSDAADQDSWEVMEKCTEQDLPDLQEVVTALGGDPATVLARFPNCDDY